MIVGAVVAVDCCCRYVAVVVVVVVVARTAGIRTVCCCLWPLHSVLERSHPRPDNEKYISYNLTKIFKAQNMDYPLNEDKSFFYYVLTEQVLSLASCLDQTAL